MKKPTLRAQLVAIVALALSLIPQSGFALNDIMQNKLFGHWAVSPANNHTWRCKLNDKWAVVSTPYASERVTGEGAVQVFNAVTGVWVRKVLPPLPAVSGVSFGYSLALYGDTLAVGATGANGGKGAVYVYNLTTGTLVRTITYAAAVASDQLGFAVAITGNRLVATAYGANAGKGAVYVFELSTGNFLGSIDLGVSGVLGDGFGGDLAADAGRVLIGAPGRSSNAGAVYLYDIETRALIMQLTPGVVTGNQLGYSVALSGPRAVVGAPNRNSGKGAVFVFNLRNASTFTEVTKTGGVANDQFGYSVAADSGKMLVTAFGESSYTGGAYFYDISVPNDASATLVRSFVPRDASTGLYFGVGASLYGNSALVNAFNDSTQALYAGATYLLTQLLTPLSFTRVVSKGDFAPGAPDTVFNLLGDAYCNAYGTVAFGGSLSGLGSNGSKDMGIWSNVVTPNSALQLVAKSRSLHAATGNQEFLSFGLPIINNQTDVLVPVTMKVGTGSPLVSAATSKWIMDRNSSTALTKYEASDFTPTPTSFNNSRVLNFTDMVQGNANGANYRANTVSLSVSPANFTTSANDSGVLYGNGTSLAFGFREGVDTIPGGGALYGQFTGRVQLPFASVTFSAATNGPVATNQVVVSSPANASSPVIAFQKGEPAPDLGGSAPTFSSIVGESMDGGPGGTYVRATLTGGTPVVTALDNEGIWRRDSGGAKSLLIRKGQAIGTTGLKIAKFITMCPGVNASPGIFGLVQLAGTGVNATNDQAVIVVQEGSTYASPNIAILMREGEPVRGPGSGTIGTISRVAFEGYYGFYLIVATVVGGPAGADLVLYSGGLYFGNNAAMTPLRRPAMLLRKGWQFDGQPSKIKSFSIPVAQHSATGFTGFGRSNCVSWTGNCTFTVEFDNGVKQIMKTSIQ